MSTPIFVTKASGEREVFSEEKLLNSLVNAGATEEIAHTIIEDVKQQLYSGIPTNKIYRLAFALLRRVSRPLAGRYHLKRAIMQLGPSGFPFEQYVAEILKYQGYTVTVGEIVNGHCVTHEVDIIAQKDGKCFMIECKFHNQSGFACTVKIPLYVQARFKDVEGLSNGIPHYESKFSQGWLVTNTRFTKDAIQYGECAGLKLLGWSYPLKNSLKNEIDESGLYPLTCITSLTQHEKQMLLGKKIVLCKHICENERLLHDIGIKGVRIKKIMEEGQRLCQLLM